MEKPKNYPDNLKLWDIFYDFTQTPRPSKKEEKIQKYLIDLATENKIKYQQDKVGNIIMYIPGKGDQKDKEAIIIQNHIDMVTDAIKGRNIDFENDPIEVFVEDGWLKANGTTLGADNGIGCAAALAVIFENNLSHPPLELLFTVDEETGLNGAQGLEPKYLSGKKMLNLDTEEWGSLYIGCAGGIDYELTRTYKFINNDKSFHYELSLEGLAGGHSGVEIHEQRANAIKCLNEFLVELNEDIYLSEYIGGRAHNIIPREISIKFSTNNDISQNLSLKLDGIEKRFLSYFKEEDKNFEFILSETDALKETMSLEDSKKFIQLINLFPHGAHSYDLNSDDNIVSLSNNLAKAILKNGEAYIQSSLRFFDREEIKKIEGQIRDLGDLFGYNVQSESEYPSWKPERENQVLDQVKSTYREVFGKDPIVTAIHAGLECGILRDKIGKIDVVSFGPTIMGAHSPDERINIKTVDDFWVLFKESLKVI